MGGKMKKLVFSVLIFALSSTAYAVKPNLINCISQDDTVSVRYSTTSFSGNPDFAYSKLVDGPGSKNIRANQERDIKIESSVLGSLVTVWDTNAPVGERATAVTLVLPDINLTENVPAVVFDTVAIETENSTPVNATVIPEGVEQNSQYFPVQCSAQKVFFLIGEDNSEPLEEE